MPDLFISYAHVDKHWVDAFVPILEQRINQYAGRAKSDRIWKDNRLASYTPIQAEIDTQLQQSLGLLSIVSPGYLVSEWCLYELDYFNQRLPMKPIFCVELDALKSDEKPEALYPLLGKQFWRQDPLSKRTYPLQAGEVAFEERLIDLAKDVVSALYTCEASQTLTTIAATPPTTHIQPSAPYRPKNYEGLEKRRATLEEMLQRQQEKLDFEDDPKREMKLERDIEYTKQQLRQVYTELGIGN